jgi:transcription elongation factor GreA
MMMETVPITRQGLEKLRQELQNIITVERPKNIKAIEEARSHGDLFENAEYHAAKERQAMLEAKINELETAINTSEVIEIDRERSDKVVFGVTVELRNMATDDCVSYQLIGPYESDPDSGRISIASPLGRALIGKEEGDEVKLKTPGGVQEFEILEIR